MMAHKITVHEYYKPSLGKKVNKAGYDRNVADAPKREKYEKPSFRKNWKRNNNTHFLKRWDNGTTEVHIKKEATSWGSAFSSSPSYTYFVGGSHSVGGFFDIGKSPFRKDAENIARQYMLNHPDGW